MTQRWIPVLVLAQLGNVGLMEAQTKGQERWVATWATAQALVRQAPARQVTAAAPAAAAPAGPATTPQAIGARGFNNQTVRMIVRTSIAGKRLRVRLSNAFGGTPVAVGSRAYRNPREGIGHRPGFGSQPELQRQTGMHPRTGRGAVQRSRGSQRPGGHRSRREPLLPRRDRPAHHPRHRAAQHLHLQGRRHHRQGGDCRARDHTVLLLARRRRRGGCRGRRGRGHLRRFHYRRRALHLGDQSQLAGPAGGAPRGQQRDREDRRGQYGDRRQSRAARRQRRKRPGALGSRRAQPAGSQVGDASWRASTTSGAKPPSRRRRSRRTS